MKLEKLVEEQQGEALDLVVEDYCICLSDVYVELSGGFLGLCYSPLEDLEVPQFRRLLGKTARGVFTFRDEENMALRALAWAAANAASVPALRAHRRLLFGASPVELLRINEGDRTLMVGNMAALRWELERCGAKVTVLERNPRLRSDALPDTFIEALAMDFDAAFLTGAAIAVPTFPRLLERILAIPKRAIIGPSASLFPEVLHQIGFHLVCGVLIEDVQRVKEWLKQGNFVAGVLEAPRMNDLGSAVKIWCSLANL